MIAKLLRRCLVALSFLPAVALAPGASAADNYPAKAIRVIVPFAPGGASDFAARILSPHLTAVLGQPVIIENRAGASGNIGMEVAAKANPDGYTVFLGNIGTISINPAAYSSLPVKPLRDFIPVSVVAEMPSILIAKDKFAGNSVGDLEKIARAEPGVLNFASPGSSTLNRLEMEQFMKSAGVKLVHVPYKGGAGPAVTGMLGGETDVMFVTLSSAMSFVKAGKLKAFAVTSQSRVEALPRVPTMIESGFPDFVTSSWQGVFVPAGTPHAIVAKLHDALVKVLAMPEVKERFAAGGVTASSSKSPEEFAAFVAAENARWGKLVHDSGATID